MTSNLTLTAGLALAALCCHSASWAHQGPHDNQSAPSVAVSRSTVSVKLPAVPVRLQTGKLITFDAAIDPNRPVLLNFIFTTCTGICLPMTQVFASAQDRLGAGAAMVQMVSVSIDPSQDTPAHLAEYAARFSAGQQWSFSTGSQQAVDSIQQAFNVYRPDKMAHTPVTFVRPLHGQQWVRLDGFASPDQLIREAMAPNPNRPTAK